jgi:hypothetical protein
MIEDGDQLGAREVVRTPHPCPTVEDVRVFLVESSTVDLVEEAHLSQGLLKRLKVPSMSRQVLDGYPNMVPF